MLVEGERPDRQRRPPWDARTHRRGRRVPEGRGRQMACPRRAARPGDVMDGAGLSPLAQPHPPSRPDSSESMGDPGAAARPRRPLRCRRQAPGAEEPPPTAVRAPTARPRPGQVAETRRRRAEGWFPGGRTSLTPLCSVGGAQRTAWPGPLLAPQRTRGRALTPSAFPARPDRGGPQAPRAASPWHSPGPRDHGQCPRRSPPLPPWTCPAHAGVTRVAADAVRRPCGRAGPTGAADDAPGPSSPRKAPISPV